MKVNKKKLAEIFNVDPRTIERWQSQGLPCVSGGGKGVESVFDTAMAIQWYAQREADMAAFRMRTHSAKALTPLPGEQGQQALLAWFNEGDTRAYKIRFPNGTVDVFRGWVSSIGKAVTAKEVITRTVKVTNVGRPSMAEDRSTVTAATRWRSRRINSHSSNGQNGPLLMRKAGG